MIGSGMWPGNHGIVLHCVLLAIMLWSVLLPNHLSVLQVNIARIFCVFAASGRWAAWGESLEFRLAVEMIIAGNVAEGIRLAVIWYFLLSIWVVACGQIQKGCVNNNWNG